MKIRPVGAELFHAVRQAEGCMDMTKPRIHFFAILQTRLKSRYRQHAFCLMQVQQIIIPQSTCLDRSLPPIAPLSLQEVQTQWHSLN